MYKLKNNTLVELTPEELAAYEAEREEVKRYEATRPLTAEERIAELEEALALLLSGEVSE